VKNLWQRGVRGSRDKLRSAAILIDQGVRASRAVSLGHQLEMARLFTN